MEDLLELLFTVILEIVSKIKFKNPKTKTRTITAVFVLLFVILTGALLCGFSAIGSTAGRIVLSVLLAGWTVIWLIVIIRGHKQNWQHT